MAGPSLDPKKSLGQHFLHDHGILSRIAGLAAGNSVASVVEIGPGTGNLTAHLLELLKRGSDESAPLWLIEVDRRVPAILQERFGPRFSLLMQDAAEVDWSGLLSHLAGPVAVVGNLPYYATMPILFALLDSPIAPSRIVVMVQREVAERIVAKASTANRGQISVKIQLRSDVELAMRVGRGAFQPPPKVESAVLVLTPRLCPYELPPWPVASRLITDAFSQRRKTIVNSLSHAGWPADAVRLALAELGLGAAVRAEAIDNRQFAALAVALAPAMPPQREPDREPRHRPDPDG